MREDGSSYLFSFLLHFSTLDLHCEQKPPECKPSAEEMLPPVHLSSVQLRCTGLQRCTPSPASSHILPVWFAAPLTGMENKNQCRSDMGFRCLKTHDSQFKGTYCHKMFCFQHHSWSLETSTATRVMGTAQCGVQPSGSYPKLDGWEPWLLQEEISA